MKPTIDQTTFGSITIEGAVFTHDVMIRRNGQVEKRKKKLSKAIYGTSHILSQAEAKHIYEKGAQLPEAIQSWNEDNGSVINLFHVTC
jgi:hypothetical protein